ncbi:MAG: hypothetical protein HN560_15570 [Anaerolineae bacterium]|jgi:hypothetical protein|nr:hypothetical protein [Anaerolineae bacterium]MBT7073087.1 hypothetical protein [Anaerolineae bacterium]MBT7602473.1 hypothetical protein [Anaerolineae bacterium]MBT7990690.1 hypothetical protein [Anaerolineae bacterium]
MLSKDEKAVIKAFGDKDTTYLSREALQTASGLGNIRFLETLKTLAQKGNVSGDSYSNSVDFSTIDLTTILGTNIEFSSNISLTDKGKKILWENGWVK